jgi:dTDP-4-amino-4,6-dideoxygalactose transaminase
LASGIKKGDIVIMPSFCCHTVAESIENIGAIPKFCEINQDFNPDIKHILQLLTDEVKAIVFPHLFGKPGLICELEYELKLKGWSSKIILIDDAAQSLGAKIDDKYIGTFGDYGIISFGPGKIITATGGGVLLTKSKKNASAVDMLTPTTFKRNQKLYELLYWILFRRWRAQTLSILPFCDTYIFKRGFKKEYLSKLCNIDAALALEQLQRLESLIGIRKKRKKRIDKVFQQYGLRNIYEPASYVKEKYVTDVCTKYVLSITEDENKSKITEAYNNQFLKKHIEIQELYEPIHLSNNKITSATLSHTENIYRRLIQIPLEPTISDRQFETIISCVRELGKKSRMIIKEKITSSN